MSEKIDQQYSHTSGIQSTTPHQRTTNGNHHHTNGNYPPEIDGDKPLDRIGTRGSISISPELFEKLYLTPENRVHGDLRKTFANPTPIAILGFVICLTPLSMDLMGWRGAGGSGAAQVASFYFIGGLFSVLGGIFEFILGNTFPFIVFTSFGGFWFTFGGTLTPTFNAAGAYSSTGADGVEGAASRGFNASFGFYLLGWGIVTFIYLICSLRTNLAFFAVFFFLDITFALLVATYFNAAEAKAELAKNLLTAAGAFALASSTAGWYIFLVQMLAALDFPISLPIGELKFIPAGSSRKSARDEV